MANDHFISRFLTRRWEAPPGRLLHYFDFGSATFGAESSEKLFADDGLHTDFTGATLNKLVEQPVAQHLRKLERDSRAELIDPKSWTTFRAFAALQWLQPLRLLEANAPGTAGMTLDQLMANGEAVIDAIGHIARDKFHLFVVKTRADERLFFTEVASFPIPLAGAVLLALPLSPNHFMTLVPRQVHAPEEGLRGVLDTPSLLSALSIGIGSNVRKVVLPPQMAPAGEEDEARLRHVFFTLRASSRQIVDLIGQASAIAGLTTWQVRN